jgi:hypothetical protein
MIEDEAIRTLVKRLARRHASGGEVIERAAILAEGEESTAILEWITSHDGQPESVAPKAAGRGLHGGRISGGGRAQSSAPARYVLPPGVLS